MIRQIKFCGKRLDNGELVFGSYERIQQYRDIPAEHFILEPQGFKSMTSRGLHWWDDKKYKQDYLKHEVDPDSVSQYTGENDRKGKEIYEGYGIKFRKFNSEYEGTVVFEKGCFIVKWESVVGAYGEKASHSEYLKFCEDIEVIGNK